MASKDFEKVNDLSNSPLRKKFVERVFIPETNLAIGFGRVSIKKNKDKGNSDLAQLETIQPSFYCGQVCSEYFELSSKE